jgi:hypothetical protein
VSVGILGRREGQFGRLGRGWLLAGRLEKMAAALAEDPDAVALLEEFWQEQMEQSTPAEESTGHSRGRATSTVSAVLQDDERLPEYHPALAILQYMDVFGPLVYRLQQAALLRKRILFVGIPPVRAMCEFGAHTGVLLGTRADMSQYTTSRFSPAYPHATRNSSCPAPKRSSACRRSFLLACTTFPP